MNRYIAFQKVVEVGSFTKAARLLGYTQPALSQMIASLERELGFKLLNRNNKRISLTEEGRELAPSISACVLQYRSIQEKAMQIRGLETGVVRIGTLTSVSCHWLPHLIAAFKRQYPKVTYVLHQGDNFTIPRWIQAGEVDFGFVNMSVFEGSAKPVKTGVYRAVLNPNHPLATKDTVTLEDLANDPFLVIDEGPDSRPLKAFAEQGLQPKESMRVHDDYTILSMVECGLGVSILPELVLRKTNYNVITKPLEPPVTRTLGIVSRSASELSLASKRFMQFIFDNESMLT